MKIALVFEQKGKQYKIPMTYKELHAVYGLIYSVWPAKGEKFVWNPKGTKTIASFQKKIEHGIHDVWFHGKMYVMEKGSLRLLQEPRYLHGKPRWKYVR